MFSIGRNFSYWVFPRCSLPRKNLRLLNCLCWLSRLADICIVCLHIFVLIAISRKYEEINPPNVEDFCYITDNTYTKEEVISFPHFNLYILVFHVHLVGLFLFLYYLILINGGLWVIPKVVKMEADILKALKFELGSPTIKTFLRQENCLYGPLSAHT